MITMSARMFLFLVVLCAATVSTIHAAPTAGSAEGKRLEQLQHLKQQFELFKKELDQVLAESNSSPVEAIAAPVEEVEDDKRCDCDASDSAKRCPTGCAEKKTKTAAETVDLVPVAEVDKRCPNDCDPSDPAKRCPNGCGTKSKTPKPAAEVEVEAEKRCEGCDDNDPEKRCPNGCKSRSKSTKTCVRRCPTCECEDSLSAAPAAASGPAPIQDSPIMKRFLNVLPAKDQELIQHARSKKQFIDRLIRRSHYGPSKEDLEAEKVATAEVADTEERSLPVEESSKMAAFKRSLSPAEQQLLKNHNSKAQAIQGLLERSVDNTKRQLDDPVVVEYMETLPEEDLNVIKAHASSEDVFKQAIYLGTNEEEPVAEKRALSSSEIQETINKLGNPEDRALVQKHISKIENLAEAEKRPVGMEEEAEKRALSSSEIQETINKLGNPEDRALVQKHISKIENLAEAEKRPVGMEEEAAKRALSSSEIQETINKLGNPSDRALVQKHISKIENLAEAEKRPVGMEEEASEIVSRLVKDIRLAKKGGVNIEELIDALKKRADAAKKSVNQ